MKIAIVKAKLKERRVGADVGATISLWGTKFTVNQAKDLFCEMPIDQANAYVDADRVEIVKTIDEPEQAADPPMSIDNFGDDPKNFFDAMESPELRKRISKLTKWQLIEFADKKLNIAMAPTNSKSKMIADICTSTENLAGAA
jgi:hypothetical protein